MKHRFLKTALASAILLSGSIIASSTVVNAADHSFHSSYWTKNKRVMTLRTVTFKRFDALRHRYTKAKKKISFGTDIYVRNAGEFNGWVLAGTKPGSRYWWVYPSTSTKWMLEDPKTYKEGWKGQTYQALNGSTFKIKNLKRVSVFNFDNETDKPDETVLVLTGRLTNNGKKTTPKKWLNNNLNIYPTGTPIKDDMPLDFFNISAGGSYLLPTDDQYSDDFFNATDDLPHNYYVDFSVILYDSDIKANNVTFSDYDNHSIDVPVTTTRADIDVED
ncbi:hypothetical protein [Lactobacillus intestinalis]|uniref:hypothetical protein n=1 Tax=Lactobacillus intestinalis TaxID=151781 RepID=UPI001F583FC2|nr:hypothetical protein [Lactobacillus intestinalis]